MSGGREPPRHICSQETNMRSATRSGTTTTSHHALELPAGAVEEMRGQLSAVADDVVAAIVEEVPSYQDAFSGSMGATIRNAVQLALGGFLTLASRGRTEDLRTPTAPAVEGSYQLGRGEARSGRLDRRAAGGVPDRRPGVVARAVHHRGAQRAAGRGAGRLRRAGLRLHRRAVRVRGRRPHRRDRDHRPGARAAARARHRPAAGERTRRRGGRGRGARRLDRRPPP